MKIENEKFDIFANELLKWNKTHKLTNYNSKEEIYAQIEDALFPIERIKNKKSAIDIGTGAGFPGLILAVAMPECEWYLSEPLKKRYSFLNYLKIVLNLKNVKIIPERIEKSNLPKVELITTRAVMPTKKIIELSKEFLEKNGIILLYKGSNVLNELENIKADIINNKNRNYVFIKSKDL